MSLLVILEAGLCALIVLAPLPFGSIPPDGRLMLELLALALTAVWIFAATRGTVALPPRSARVALIGLLVIAALQAIPLGATAVSALSPRAAALHGGLDPVPDPTLSMAPDATASARFDHRGGEGACADGALDQRGRREFHNPRRPISSHVSALGDYLGAESCGVVGLTLKAARLTIAR